MQDNRIKIYNESDNPTPKYATEGSAGFDVQANIIPLEILNKNDKVGLHNIYYSETIVPGIEIYPGDRVLIPTGLFLSIPKNTELEIRPRSGLAIKQGLGIINSPGTLDSDYRGELCVGVINLGQKDIKILHGDRIAQCVLTPYIRAEFDVIDKKENLDITIRGEGGFGHTGQ